MKKKMILIGLVILSLLTVGCGRSDIENQAIKYYEAIDNYMVNDVEIPEETRNKIRYYTDKIEKVDLTEHEYDVVTGIYKMFLLARNKTIAKSVGTHNENRDYMEEYKQVKKEVAQTLNIN